MWSTARWAIRAPGQRIVWLDAVAARPALCPHRERDDHFRRAARRIYATFAVSVSERGDAMRILAERLFRSPRTSAAPAL